MRIIKTTEEFEAHNGHKVLSIKKFKESSIKNDDYKILGNLKLIKE
jgi:hypothetical protein